MCFDLGLGYLKTCKFKLNSQYNIGTHEYTQNFYKLRATPTVIVKNVL